MKNEYATIGFYGKKTKDRFIKLMNEYKSLYSLTTHSLTDDKAVKITTSDILEGLCDILENDIKKMKENL